MQDGRHLAELLTYYRDYRTAYLDWATARAYPETETLHNYRRALVGWYETSMDAEQPYRGDVLDYVTAVAAVYFGQSLPAAELPLGDDPLAHLPRPVTVDVAGQQLLVRFQALPKDCRDLLLLADYHQLDRLSLARAVEAADPDTLTDRLEACRAQVGIDHPAMALLWPSVITLAGRQDLLSTLSREEDKLAQPLAPAAPPVATTDVPPAIRSPRNIKLPSLEILVAGALFGVFLYLAYTTFGGVSTGSLYDRYFQPYPNIFADQPPQTENERDLQRILYYYDRGEYRTAYDELLPTADVYPAAPLYLGVTALALNDPARARDWLAELAAGSPYYAAAQWYTALAQLAQGGAAGAKISLAGIANAPDHPYRQAAQQLLSDL